MDASGTNRNPDFQHASELGSRTNHVVAQRGILASHVGGDSKVKTRVRGGVLVRDQHHSTRPPSRRCAAWFIYLTFCTLNQP